VTRREAKNNIINFCTAGSYLNHEIRPVSGWGREVTMNSPLVIVLVAIVLVAVGTLAVMNNACKASQHEWCAPTSSMRHQIKTD